MATKKDLTKEEKIKREFSRLKRIFKDLDKNKLQTVESLIKNAAFMAVSLEELQEIINEEGYTVEYAKTGAGAERTDGIQRDCESERPCKAHLHDHEFDGTLPEEIPFYTGKPHTG